MNLNNQNIAFRQLGKHDAPVFQALRQEVTRENPVPMGLTLKEELARALVGFEAQLSASPPDAVFGAFIEGHLAATAAVSLVSRFASSQHKMSMWGVFTSPRYRRRGLSRQVVGLAVEHAFSNGIQRVNLQVYTPNEPAISMYKSIGFNEYGIEPDAVYIDGCYYDGVQMTLVSSSLELQH